MTFGRVNPQFSLEDQQISGLGLGQLDWLTRIELGLDIAGQGCAHTAVRSINQAAVVIGTWSGRAAAIGASQRLHRCIGDSGTCVCCRGDLVVTAARRAAAAGSGQRSDGDQHEGTSASCARHRGWGCHA